MSGKFKLMAIAVATIAVAIAATSAHAARDSMKIAAYTKFLTMEPYQTSSRLMLQMGYMIWDPLVLRDPDDAKASGYCLPADCL